MGDAGRAGGGLTPTDSGTGGLTPPARLSVFTASDGYRFYHRTYSPPTPPVGRLVFVHGIRSHGGWYAGSCGRFAAAGYEVHFLDRRGAGLNTAARGDTPSFRRLLDDVAEFVQALRGDRPGLSVVLAGISWGGKLAAALPYRRPGLVDGLVLLCPGLVPKVAPPLVRRARIAVARVFRPGRFFPIPLNEPELFTGSAEWQDYIDRDRYGLREATARFLFGSFSLDIYLRRALPRVTVPTLLVVGGRDRVIDTPATRLAAGRFGVPVSVLDYPDAHHTLEFEPAGCPWVEDVRRWLATRVG